MSICIHKSGYCKTTNTALHIYLVRPSGRKRWFTCRNVPGVSSNPAGDTYFHFLLPFCSKQLGANADEIEHEHSLVFIVALDPRYDKSYKAFRLIAAVSLFHKRIRRSWIFVLAKTTINYLYSEDGKPRQHLKNWVPISLDNAVYKSFFVFLNDWNTNQFRQFGFVPCPESVRNRCVVEVFGAVFVLSCCFLDFLVVVGVFVIELSLIFSFFSCCDIGENIRLSKLYLWFPKQVFFLRSFNYPGAVHKGIQLLLTSFFC